MNKDCLKAITKYKDKDNPVYNSKLYWQWIEHNFNEKDIKECLKRVKGLRWGGKIIRGSELVPTKPGRQATNLSDFPSKNRITGKLLNFRSIKDKVYDTEMDRYLRISTKKHISNHDKLIDKLTNKE